MTAAIVPTVTGWQGGFSNLLNSFNGDPLKSYAFPTAAQNGARPPMDSQIARIFKRNTYRGINALMIQLIGAAAGGTATATHKQVGAPNTGPEAAVPQVTGIGDFGGNRDIETVTDVNRATTASDVTWLSKYVNDKLLEAGISYPAVVGSGGGGKLVNGVNRF